METLNTVKASLQFLTLLLIQKAYIWLCNDRFMHRSTVPITILETTMIFTVKRIAQMLSTEMQSDTLTPYVPKL